MSNRESGPDKSRLRDLEETKLRLQIWQIALAILLTVITVAARLSGFL